MRRVVITGLGIVAPTGNSVIDAWQSALHARSGVGPISLFDTTELPVKIAAQVRNFDARQIMGPKQARQSSRFVQFAIAAAGEALRDSGLDLTKQPDRCGCSIGVSVGSIEHIVSAEHTLCDKGADRVSPFVVPYMIPNTAAGSVSVSAGAKGPHLCVATACASGTNAIGEAFLHIATGLADAMIAGGAEGAITPVAIASFAKMRALSTRNDHPANASRPFDLDRDGFVIGEGSGIVVLEEYESAKRRGARVYAELVGYGMSSDAHHITNPHPEGMGIARCLAQALRMGQINPQDVSYINAHGTSTKANDACESAAIETVFGEHTRQLSVSSTKGVTGHCLGAAGGIEAVYTALAVHHQVVPPTANYDTPDPACRLDYTPHHPRQRPIHVAISNSAGFGGTNACIVMKRFV